MNEEQIRYVFEVVTDDAVSGLNSLSSAFNALGRGFKQAGSLSKSVSKTFDGVTKSVKGLTKAFSALTGVAIGKALSDGAKEAIDLYESINLLKVTFGDASDEAQEFVEHITDMYGFDTRTIVDMMGSFKAMGNAVGMTSDVSSELSKSLTAMTVDLSSLLNMELDTAFSRVQSAMRGMSRAALRLNMDIRATTVEAYANSKGINKQFETMTEAERELLRYMLMVEQSQDAMGDFANTADFNANRLRVLNQQFTEVGRVIGQFFKPALDAVLPVLIGVTMVVKELLLMLAGLMGVSINWDDIAGGSGGQGFYDAQEGIEGIGSAADDTKKKINKLLAPFDELNVLSENTDSSGAGGFDGWTDVDPAILALFKEMQYELANADTKANQIKESILSFMGITPNGDSWVYAPDVFEKNLKEKLPNWTKTIEALFDIDYTRLLGNVTTIFTDVGNIFKRSIQIILEDFEELTGFDFSDSSFATWLGNLNVNLENLHTWLSNNQEDIANFIAKFIEFAAAATVISAVLAPVGQILITVGIALAAIGGGFSGISAIISTLQPIVGTLLGALGKLVSFLTLNLTGYGLAALALFVAGFIDGFKRIWENSTQFRENLSMLFENFKGLLSSIVTLVKNVVTTVIDMVRPAIETIGELLQPIYPLITGIINAIIGAVRGLVDAVNGLLTGDLSAVFKGFMKILMGIVEAVMNLGAGIVNTIISVIVSAINAIGRLVYGFIKGVIDAINAVITLVGISSIRYPRESLFIIQNVPQIVPPAFDYSFGAGGVVTGPTRALIGETGRDEAVIPLDNSPQMLDLIDKIADKVNQGGETVVKVYIGDREWDAFTYESAQRGSQLVGAQPIVIGG